MSATTGACAFAFATQAKDCPLYEKHTKEYLNDNLIKAYIVSCIKM